MFQSDTDVTKSCWERKPNLMTSKGQFSGSWDYYAIRPTLQYGPWFLEYWFESWLPGENTI